METRGSERLRTRTNRSVGWLGAVLALSLLAVSCSGPGDEAADMAAPDAAASPIDSTDVSGDRADSGTESYAATTTAAPRSRTDDAMAEPEPEEEPMAEEEAFVALEAAQAAADAAPAEAVAELEAELEAAMAEAESAMAAAESAAAATSSGVSREEAAASDRRRCPECRANTF